MTFGTRLALLRKDQRLSQSELAQKLGVAASTVSMYELSKREPDFEMEEAIANFFDVDLNYLRGISTQKKSPEDNALFLGKDFMPVPKTIKVPRLGAIACGTPILAQENVETYDYVDENLHCDFTLQCKGVSMVPRLQDNDIVLIKQQPEIENGEIAAVLIGEEATLKRVHKNENGLILTAENPDFPPMIFTGSQLENICIIGKAVGLIRYF